MLEHQFVCIAYDRVLQKYRQPSNYEEGNDGEMELEEVPHNFPPEK